MTAPGKPLDLDGMEAVARAATQGEWATDYRFGEASMVILDDAGRLPLASTALYPLAQNNTLVVQANAAHIATFDPPTVLALIQMQRELVGALKGLLEHEGIAAAAPEDVDGEDRALESQARAVLAKALGEQPL